MKKKIRIECMFKKYQNEDRKLRWMCSPKKVTMNQKLYIRTYKSHVKKSLN